MIATPPHNRKLGVLEVSLTKQRVMPQWGDALDRVRDQIEKVIIDSGYLDGAPFSWVTIAVRYGLKNDESPKYQAINKKYGDLPLSIEVDTQVLINSPVDELISIFSLAILKALIHAGKKFDRPIEMLAKIKGDGGIKEPEEGKEPEGTHAPEKES